MVISLLQFIVSDISHIRGMRDLGGIRSNWPIVTLVQEYGESCIFHQSFGDRRAYRHAQSSNPVYPLARPSPNYAAATNCSIKAALFICSQCSTMRPPCTR